MSNFRYLLLLLIIFISLSASAQLCTGSLGDPTIDINFGAGNNPGPPVFAATTNYQYSSADCPNDGFYTVRSNTSDCFGSTWHNIISDHTGTGGGGYFMLVNASVQPSSFYVRTIKSLCGNTTFQFAAWVMNVIVPGACSGSSIQPNITFSIERTDGTLLQSYNTGDIPTTSSPQWKQFGFFFTTPPGSTDVVLRMINNAAGGCGNDLALDDITFRSCGPLLTTSVAGSSNTISLCEGQAHTYVFNCAISPGFSNPTFQWQQSNTGISYSDIPGATGSSYSKSFPANTSPGTHYYRCTVAELGNIGSVACRISSSIIKVIIDVQPTTTAVSNTPVCQNSILSLTATGGTGYQWSGPNGFSSTDAAPQILNVQPAASGTYYVTATNGGCFATASTIVIVNPIPVAAVLFTDSTICYGKTVKLSASGGGTYSWSPASSLSVTNVAEPLASPADTTRYEVIVKNNSGCTDTAYTTMNVIVKPVVNAGADRTLIKGNSIQLSGNVSGSVVNYIWSPNTFINNINVLSPVVSPDADIEYTLTATAANSCGVVSDVVSVKVFNSLYIPNAFTPNGDSRNDTWNIPALAAFPKAQLVVFDRYGEKVFEGTGAQNTGWDGRFKSKNLPAGNYVYVINPGDGSPVIKGSVLLLR